MKQSDRDILIRIDERTLQHSKDIAALTAKVDKQNGQVKDNKAQISKVKIAIWILGAVLLGGGGAAATPAVSSLFKAFIGG